jgi:NIPSNAP protein
MQQNPAHAADTRTYELRTYHCNPGKLNDLLTRFRDHTMALFERHGMKNVAYWVPADEPAKANTLIYIISHESRGQAKKNWGEFRADPEWKKVQSASEVNGKLVEKMDSVFMEPTDFSPMK